ncbi:MAG: hypothetical protein ACI4HK_06175 [Ruminococcus sp.]
MLNRSIICRIANSLRKYGYTLSQAFRMAWRLAKGKASVKAVVYAWRCRCVCFFSYLYI